MSYLNKPVNAQNQSNSIQDTPPITASLGMYFAKKTYVPKPLPTYSETKSLLPSPILDESPDYLRMYWKAWELGFKNFHEPQPGSGFVSQFIDAAFNENIFLWDSCFMTMFCNVAHPLVPGISTLDNFYAKQYPDGEISREINRTTGKVYEPWINKEGSSLHSRWGFSEAGNGPIVYVGRKAPKTPPQLTLDSLDNPLFAWAEMESFKMTGDKERLRLVYEPLVKYYEALHEYLRQGNGLYMTDWASMDNSSRNQYLKGGGCGVDISCEMVFYARELSEMARILGKPNDAVKYEREARKLSGIINRLMWNPKQKFYFDLTVEGKQVPIKTIAAYWSMIAGVATKEQSDALIAELNNPATFDRMHRVPTLAADQPGYDPQGGYWQGAVWAPTNTMILRGLEKYGENELARSIALQDLDVTYQVFNQTGTIWENYAPDSATPGKPAKSDFVGWSGIGPILYLLEYRIGLKPDSEQNKLQWDIHATKKIGCERYRFNGHVMNLLAVPSKNEKGWDIAIHSDGPFNLQINISGKKYVYPVKKGDNQYHLT